MWMFFFGRVVFEGLKKIGFVRFWWRSKFGVVVERFGGVARVVLVCIRVAERWVLFG